MVRHQQFDESAARARDFRRGGRDRSCPSSAGRTHEAVRTRRADIDDADPANSDGHFVLLMTESGDANAVEARGVEDRRARRDGNLATVNRK